MKQKYLVVGAGVNGLCISDTLCAAGHDVTIVEANDSIGGLCKTFEYEGFKFDSGPHWIYINSQRMDDYLTQLLGEGCLYKELLAPGVFFLNKYYKWPLTLGVIKKLPFKVMAGAMFDMLKIALSKRAPATNYEELTLQKFGKTLYKLDFGPYTEKFTKTPLTQLHVDWSKIGVNRSVDEDISLESMFSLVKKTLSPKKPTYGWYTHEGIQAIPNAQAKRIQKNGGKILTNTAVTAVQLENSRIVSASFNNGQAEEFDHIIWTGRPNDIAQLVLNRQYEFDYITNVFFNVSIKGTDYQPFQWIYYVDENILFNRMYNTVKFSNTHAPKECHGLCLEVTCRAGGDLELHPEKYVDRVIDDLLKVRAIKSRADVIGVHCEVTKCAYPLYTLTYREQLADCMSSLHKACHNLSLTGRGGMFWYNNIDHTLDNAFAETDALLKGQRIERKITL